MTAGHQSTALPGREIYEMEGHDVYDADGQKVGTATTLYVPDGPVAAKPEWVAVKTGLFGTEEPFVPLAGAWADEAGLHVRARKDDIMAAPRADEDTGLTDDEIGDLYRHYGLARDTGSQAAGTGSGRVRLRRYVIIEEQAEPGDDAGHRP